MKKDPLVTGWPTLDHLTGGFGRGELTVIAARPGVGKSSFVMEIMRRNSAEGSGRIVVFALDITKENFANRLLSQVSGVNFENASALGEDQWEKLKKAAVWIGKTSIFVDDAPGLTPKSVFERCFKLASEVGPIDLIIVDYLQLMRAEEERPGARALELADICRSLKRVAKELDCPILLACQLERAQVQRGGRPSLLTVREMAPIEASVDTLLLLHRYDDEMECIVGKARNGSNGMVRLACQAGEGGLVFGDERTERR